MSEPSLKCVNTCAIFKQNYNPKLFFNFKMAYSCRFSLGGIQILQISSKKFYNIDYQCSTVLTNLGFSYLLPHKIIHNFQMKICQFKCKMINKHLVNVKAVRSRDKLYPIRLHFHFFDRKSMVVVVQFICIRRRQPPLDPVSMRNQLRNNR